MTTLAEQELAWTARQGSTYHARWTSDGGALDADPATLVVQIRKGDTGTSADTLIASYPAVTGSVTIDVTGTDLTLATPVFEIEIAASGTATFAATPAEYWIEAEVEIGGRVTALIPAREFHVTPRVAVAS